MNLAFLLFSLTTCVARGRLMGNVHPDRRSLRSTFPSYSQQCRDDAGPPFQDDEETFGPGRKYHYGSPAKPILKNGKCADPLKFACDERNDAKLAYLEGPIQCGGNGWYCRIYEEPGWPQINLRGDFNFGDCNTAEGFNDHGWDGSGHCHGSDDDSTYYWWIRDHWFRQYNGRVRCCCNWAAGEDPLRAGKVANRCDFRRKVQRSENCRDANEGHNMGFDDVGCVGASSDGIGKPLKENDAMCWEMSKFGAPSEAGDGNDEVPLATDEEGSGEEETEEEETEGNEDGSVEEGSEETNEGYIEEGSAEEEGSVEEGSQEEEGGLDGEEESGEEGSEEVDEGSTEEGSAEEEGSVEEGSEEEEGGLDGEEESGEEGSEEVDEGSMEEGSAEEEAIEEEEEGSMEERSDDEEEEEGSNEGWSGEEGSEEEEEGSEED